MLPVVLSIAVLVLMSVAVLWVVADEGRAKPTSAAVVSGGSSPALAAAEPDGDPADEPVAPSVVDLPPLTVAATTIALPRHRLRSSVLLVLYVVIVGLLMAAVVGAAAAGLAVALREAVTS